MGKSFVLNFHNEEDGIIFEQVIVALKTRYQLVSIEQLEELLLSKKKLNNICHISFDDGEKSFYRVVFPILQKHRVPVSLFLSPEIIAENKNFWFQEIRGYDTSVLKDIIAKKLGIPLVKINMFACKDIFKSLTYKQINEIIAAYQSATGCEVKESYNISLNELRTVVASGLVTIGAHTIDHPILQNETDIDSFNEITASIEKLGDLLGHPVKYFAYPNGRPGIDFGEREMQYLQEKGISMAFSTGGYYLSSNNNRLSVPRMGFPRMGLSPSNPFIYFRLSLGSKWIDIKSLFTPKEKTIRRRINALLKTAKMQ